MIEGEDEGEAGINFSGNCFRCGEAAIYSLLEYSRDQASLN